VKSFGKDESGMDAEHPIRELFANALPTELAITALFDSIASASVNPDDILTPLRGVLSRVLANLGTAGLLTRSSEGSEVLVSLTAQGRASAEEMGIEAILNETPHKRPFRVGGFPIVDEDAAGATDTLFVTPLFDPSRYVLNVLHLTPKVGDAMVPARGTSKLREYYERLVRESGAKQTFDPSTIREIFLHASIGEPDDNAQTLVVQDQTLGQPVILHVYGHGISALGGAKPSRQAVGWALSMS
jgi:hypothetical protein